MAYSVGQSGQIINSVCLCPCMCPSVCLSVCLSARTLTVTTPKNKNDFVGGKHRTTRPLPLICPQLRYPFQNREWVTQSDPWPKWPIELASWPIDPWPMGYPGRHPSASLTQNYRLPGTVVGHCICTHTFKLLHNCTCKQTAHTGTCNLEFATWKLKHCIT